MIGFVTRVVDWLVHGPPRRYGWLYLATTVAFWIVYLVLPAGSFSQSTLRGEQAPLHDARQGLTDITLLALRESHGIDASGTIEIAPGWSVPVRDLKVREVETADRFVELRLVGSVVEAPTASAVTAYAPEAFQTSMRISTIPIPLQIGPEGVFVFGVERLAPLEFAPEVVDPPPQLTVDDLLGEPLLELEVDGSATSELGTGAFDGVPTAVFSESLVLDAGEADQFQQHHRALNLGDPSAASGKATRLLYYSTTTITTLGLGDIVPVSSTARLLAVSQSIIGLVWAGLFLNALADKRARHPTEEEPPRVAVNSEPEGD